MSGARKDSELYLFLHTPRVAEIMVESERTMYITHRSAVISCHDWPWHCVQAAIAPGFIPGGVHDRVIYHEFAQSWPDPTGVTRESWEKWQDFKNDPPLRYRA